MTFDIFQQESNVDPQFSAQNSAEPITKGESRKNASARLGISHDTAEKALKVVTSADELKAEGKTEQAQKLLDTAGNACME